MLTREVVLCIHREFPGPENAKFRTAIKNAIRRTGSVDCLYRQFKRFTYGTLGLDAIRNVVAFERRFATNTSAASNQLGV